MLLSLGQGFAPDLTAAGNICPSVRGGLGGNLKHGWTENLRLLGHVNTVCVWAEPSRGRTKEGEVPEKGRGQRRGGTIEGEGPERGKGQRGGGTSLKRGIFLTV